MKRTGRGLRIGRQLDSGGAGGAIHAVEGDPRSVAKLLKRTGPQQEQRLRAMLALGLPAQVPHAQAAIAWPTDLVFDEAGKVCGFVMPAAAGPQPVRLYRLINPVERELLVKNLSWRQLVWIGHNVAAAYAHLHGRGVIVNDVNESNAMVGGGGFVTVLDADSMQFTDARGRVWLSGYRKAEYLAPELDGVDLRRFQRAAVHDDYAYAVLLFSLLMNGFGPFDGVPTGSGELDHHTRARDGRFPFAGRDAGLRPPPGAPSWDVLTPNLQDRFERTFTAGTDGSRRTTALEWQQELRVAVGELCLCAANLHYYPRVRGVCPWCRQAGIPTGPGQSRRADRAAGSPAGGPLRRTAVAAVALAPARRPLARSLALVVIATLLAIMAIAVLVATSHRDDPTIGAARTTERAPTLPLAPAAAQAATTRNGDHDA